MSKALAYGEPVTDTEAPVRDEPVSHGYSSSGDAAGVRQLVAACHCLFCTSAPLPCTAQVLPVNDTSVYRMWWDSYPYSTLSVFALHPLYLRLQGLRLELPADILSDIAQLRERLDGPQVRAAISRAQAG